MKTTLISLLFVASTASAKPASDAPADLAVTSTAFTMNQTIPVEYTCTGSETAPELSWSRPPAGTRSIALLVEDPDAPKGTVTHWLVTGIAPTMTSLAKGGALPSGAVAAKNEKGKPGYMGPCPPNGLHHYYFKVFALDVAVPTPILKPAFIAMIQGHVLAQGELVGTYSK
jgi:Raf kinase inhibitor-like YbhB/YbcL family protein